MAGYKSKLQETCGDEEYDTLKENLYNGIEQAKRFVSSPRQTRKHCFLAMFPKGGQTRKHCFLAMFPKGG